MKIPTKDAQILQHIVKYCDQIETTVRLYHVTKKEFEENFVMQNALSMPILQIGELTKRLSEEFRATHNDIPWRSIAGTRDRLTHDYVKMDTNVTWEIISNDISDLSQKCKHILIKNNIPLPQLDKISDSHNNRVR